jgi:hypothetical protein
MMKESEGNLEKASGLKAFGFKLSFGVSLVPLSSLIVARVSALQKLLTIVLNSKKKYHKMIEQSVSPFISFFSPITPKAIPQNNHASQPTQSAEASLMSSSLRFRFHQQHPFPASMLPKAS